MIVIGLGFCNGMMRHIAVTDMHVLRCMACGDISFDKITDDQIETTLEKHLEHINPATSGQTTGRERPQNPRVDTLGRANRDQHGAEPRRTPALSNHKPRLGTVSGFSQDSEAGFAASTALCWEEVLLKSHLRTYATTLVSRFRFIFS
jgi:hypothetical protein